MLVSRLKAIPGSVYAAPVVVFSQQKEELKKLERGVHLTFLSNYQIKSCEEYQFGYISVWLFPKGKVPFRTFRALYMLELGVPNLKVAAQMHRAKVRKAAENKKYKEKQKAQDPKIRYDKRVYEPSEQAKEHLKELTEKSRTRADSRKYEAPEAAKREKKGARYGMNHMLNALRAERQKQG